MTRYIVIAAAALAAYLIFRNKTDGSALANNVSERPPSDGFAGPSVNSMAPQETPRKNELAQKSFAPPASGAYRFGSQASGAMNIKTDEGLTPPGSIGNGRRRKY